MTRRISTSAPFVTVLAVLLASCFDSTPDPDPIAAGDPSAAAGSGSTAKPEVRRVEITGYQEALDLFAELNYTPEAWQAGIREVPRVFLTRISDNWRNKTVHEITVQMKKRLFFRALAPLVLRSNEMILQDRGRLAGIRETGTASLSVEDTSWLTQLAERYDAGSPGNPLSDEEVEALWTRVDIIPVALALSQGAEESGWGTSRFAAQGNALFGQWTWGEHAMKPEKQRSKLGDYGIAAFETPLQSVVAYMLNLNTHRAYADLRARRAAARARGEVPTGRDLAKGLTNYSERGEDYVKSLHVIMSVNNLDAADEAYLSDGPVIYLYPVGGAPETAT